MLPAPTQPRILRSDHGCFQARLVGPSGANTDLVRPHHARSSNMVLVFRSQIVLNPIEKLHKARILRRELDNLKAPIFILVNISRDGASSRAHAWKSSVLFASPDGHQLAEREPSQPSRSSSLLASEHSLALQQSVGGTALVVPLRSPGITAQTHGPSNWSAPHQCEMTPRNKFAFLTC